MAVQDLINDARSYSASVLSDATGALGDAREAITSIGYTIVTPPNVPMPSPPDMGQSIEAPTLANIAFDLPPAPASTYQLQAISALDAGTAPVLVGTAPNIATPSKPSQLGAFAESAPGINLSASFPEAPPLFTPTDPVLSDLNAPTKPQVSLPSFGATRPGIAPVVSSLEPAVRAAYADAAPQFMAVVNGLVDAELSKLNPQYHTQMAAIEAQLSRYLAGGTGLAPAVEDAIYARARSKQDAEARRVRDQSLADFAARGFTLPNGALQSSVQQARQAGADNNAAAAREIVVMQAEMEQKNLQFAVTTSTGLRTAMVSAVLSYMQNLTALNGQALDYAKSILSALVETYNAQVRAYSAQLDAYKAEASVYETLVRAAMAQIEIYKAEVDALQAMTQVDQSRVAIYKARIDAMASMTSMYKTQVEAVVSKAALEKLKIDLYQAKVQAYGAQVQAKNAEWQGYVAELGGEEAKVRVYQSQVQSYSAQVQGYAATIAAKSEVVKAQALTNDALAKQYVAQVNAYQSVVSAQGEVARTRLENQRQEIVAFQAKTSAQVANFQVRSEYYKATAQIGIENARLSVQSLLASAENMRKYGESVANVAVSSAHVYSGLAGAAVAGMNTLLAQTVTE